MAFHELEEGDEEFLEEFFSTTHLAIMTSALARKWIRREDF